MKVKEIIDNLINGSEPLEKSLQRARILAIKINDTDLKKWIDLEINGYESGEELPLYRKSTSGNVTYSGINGSFKVKNIALDLSWFDDKIKKAIQDNVIIYGIKTIENIIERDSEMAVDWTSLAGIISNKTEGGIQCTSIIKTVPNAIFQKVYEEVKSKLIYKLVEIQKSQGDIDNIEADPAHDIDIANTNNNVFIIHGHHDSLRQELCNLLIKEFGISPIVLSEQPADGITTFLEKFEKHAKQCCFAFALFTPDDIVSNDTVRYFQVRPNVIFELGWFISHFNRKRVCILNQAGCGTEIFSDLHGIERLEFVSHVEELYIRIRNELKTAGVVD
jgi:predicted nucleotide-binding protein